MASPTSVVASFLLLCLIPLLSCSAADAADSVRVDRTRVAAIAEALSRKGYNAMSLTLEMTLQTLVGSSSGNASSAITIFSPPDGAFFTPEHGQPPLTLLQYHVAPLKLDREALDSSSSASLKSGSRIDTLLPGHPLVVTTRAPHASINEVEIADWDLYNDGAVIVHGVKDFFDPGFQALRYPWYDGPARADAESDGHAAKEEAEDSGEGISRRTLASLGIACGFVAVVVLLASFYCCAKDDGEYIKLISALNTKY